MIVIGDIKRGDIASTAEAYAAHIRGVMVEDQRLDPWKEDAVTLNPYLGTDGLHLFFPPATILTKASLSWSEPAILGG
jgi:orotidine-5'-phosphate decarboxylase